MSISPCHRVWERSRRLYRCGLCFFYSPTYHFVFKLHFGISSCQPMFRLTSKFFSDHFPRSRQFSSKLLFAPLFTASLPVFHFYMSTIADCTSAYLADIELFELLCCINFGFIAVRPPNPRDICIVFLYTLKKFRWTIFASMNAMLPWRFLLSIWCTHTHSHGIIQCNFGSWWSIKQRDLTRG